MEIECNEIDEKEFFAIAGVVVAMFSICIALLKIWT